MESHLIDGFLGRSALILGLVLSLLPIAESQFRSGYFDRNSSSVISFWGVAVMVIGASTSLYSVVLSASELDTPGQSIWVPEFESFKKWFLPVLRQTQFGQTWQLLVLGLVSTSLIRAYEISRERFLPPPVQAGAGLLMIALLTRIGHGGIFGLLSFWFWVHVFHLSAVIVWLASVGSFALYVFSTSHTNRSFSLIRFSSTMNVVMPVLLITGILRGFEVFPLRAGFIHESYLWILFLKVAAVVAVVLLAFLLRRKITRKIQKTRTIRKEQLISTFSAEVAAAGFIVFLSTLLSQLAPP